jgi:hypothetical protein
MRDYKNPIRLTVVKHVMAKSATRCDAGCSYRDGHHCDLFEVDLKPVSKGPKESTCRRSKFCITAEKVADEPPRLSNPPGPWIDLEC